MYCQQCGEPFEFCGCTEVRDTSLPDDTPARSRRTFPSTHHASQRLSTRASASEEIDAAEAALETEETFEQFIGGRAEHDAAEIEIAAEADRSKNHARTEPAPGTATPENKDAMKSTSPYDPQEAPDTWRDEVHNRLNSYRAKRGRQPAESLPLFEPSVTNIPSTPAKARAHELLEQFRRQAMNPAYVASTSPPAISQPVMGFAAAVESTPARLIPDPDDDFWPKLPAFDEQFISSAHAGDEVAMQPEITAAPEQPAAQDEAPRRYYIEPVDVPPHKQAPSPVVAQQPKLIEFPRLTTVTEPSREELADPVFDTPRILDVPEEIVQHAAPPPPLSGIAFDYEPEETWEEPEIELPIQPAPLGLRLYSALIDAVVVLLSSGALWLGFFTVLNPPSSRIVLAMGVVTTLVLWTVYHSLFLQFTGRTPGMQMAQLEIERFDGETVTRGDMQFRITAMVLSLGAAGLGYLWTLLDADQLGWHDRITRTYLRIEE